MLELKTLLLLIVANGAPVVAARLFGGLGGCPLDANVRFLDGRPLFGPSKTVRGIVSSIVVSALAAAVMGWSWQFGALFGVFVMLGDLMSSFTKRRLGMASSSMAIGIDQIPESLVPLLFLHQQLGLSWQSVGVIVLAFFIIELLGSQILFKLKIRRHPY
jgi:CDP-2,3-bis-(O-geranylgeranyl)-sn-glycerol synthase